ncbi:hypothetical protein [Azohydromonas caseinilytica]|uniref:Uncharacterized protein n=1 Tax=Azohydromonas caseinilytica TaxID=2728836 RepID=A0A848F372_9BURK|nr:hypothetical protein [Azohydromonas caseinilytica]NML14517.1 hypothetical protein [Azohydromonas caseinilytica]
MSQHRKLLLAVALSALSAASFAQSSTTTTPDSTVGVTPSEAREAMKEAVPRSDTATVTRTGESAADKARQAGNATADALTPGTNRDTASGSANSTTGSGTGGTGMSGGSDTSSAAGTSTRAPRADRH